MGKLRYHRYTIYMMECFEISFDVKNTLGMRLTGTAKDDRWKLTN